MLKLTSFIPPFPRHNKAISVCREAKNLNLLTEAGMSLGFLTKQLFIFLSWESHIIIKYYIGKLLS